MATFVGGDVVYHLIPTSNHNELTTDYYFQKVVYHLIPTSNHNRLLLDAIPDTLYII